ncbi:MAG: type II toxin-antitoxin system Phd/YefM family antitoxin [Chloroflexi bacterium]|jgi:prevent-host-death family protein|nr:type II toxin-antitoxin system Phd/YefM family antitoxin [Chloroflexota bacterium]
MRKAALSEVKDDLSRYLKLAEKEEIVITRHGRPAGVLIGFESEDDWFDYRLENDPRFLKRVEAARSSLRAGRGLSLEEVGLSPRQARGVTLRAKVRKPSDVAPYRRRRSMGGQPGFTPEEWERLTGTRITGEPIEEAPPQPPGPG